MSNVRLQLIVRRYQTTAAIILTFDGAFGRRHFTSISATTAVVDSGRHVQLERNI